MPDSDGPDIQLHLLRHADAGDPDAWTGPEEVRPLSDKGRRQSERLGRFLRSIGFKPDAILTSPKVRAAQTAEIVAEAIGVPVVAEPRLGEGVTLSAVEAILADAGDPAKPVLVGHDPDLTELLGELCASARVPLKKGALARIDIQRPLRPGRGALHWLVPPDLLPRGR
jgi:phosphohistidine phosphatase